MKNEEFENLLKLAELTHKEFAKMNDLHKGSVSNWKKKGVPGWVKPWLTYYIKSQSFDELIAKVNNIKTQLDG